MDAEKIVPYAIGGLVIGAGIFFFVKGTGSNTIMTSDAIQPPDNSPQVTAVAQYGAERLNAGLQAYTALASVVNNKIVSAFDYSTALSNNSRDVEIARIDSEVQHSAIKAGARSQKHHDNMQTIASIASIVAFAAFCYDDTFDARLDWQPNPNGFRRVISWR